ncbi:MAG TPA: hypothetical protein VGH19_06400 [Verrucomicrobiae bacterium]
MKATEKDEGMEGMSNPAGPLRQGVSSGGTMGAILASFIEIEREKPGESTKGKKCCHNQGRSDSGKDVIRSHAKATFEILDLADRAGFPNIKQTEQAEDGEDAEPVVAREEIADGGHRLSRFPQKDHPRQEADGQSDDLIQDHGGRIVLIQDFLGAFADPDGGRNAQ